MTEELKAFATCPSCKDDKYDALSRIVCDDLIKQYSEIPDPVAKVTKDWNDCLECNDTREAAFKALCFLNPEYDEALLAMIFLSGSTI